MGANIASIREDVFLKRARDTMLFECLREEAEICFVVTDADARECSTDVGTVKLTGHRPGVP